MTIAMDAAIYPFGGDGKSSKEPETVSGNVPPSRKVGYVTVRRRTSKRSR